MPLFHGKQQDNLELYQEVLDLAQQIIKLVNEGKLSFEFSQVKGNRFYQSNGYQPGFCVYTPEGITFVDSVDQDPLPNAMYASESQLFQMKRGLTGVINSVRQ